MSGKQSDKSQLLKKRRDGENNPEFSSSLLKSELEGTTHLSSNQSEVLITTDSYPQQDQSHRKV